MKNDQRPLVAGGRDPAYGTDTVGVPDRYLVQERGKSRVLVCTEAPTVVVRVERGLTVAAGAARKSPPATIYLDGAAQCEPFIDAEKQVYNLDHHEGCVRAFTLATCEQAVILVRRRLNLRERDWTVFANEPDLDTIFAIWVLLNHIRLNDDDPEIRRVIMPLLRLQGTIDALGLDMIELSGLPEDLQRSTLLQLEELRAGEQALKKDGRWQEMDFPEYTADVLRAIDALVYRPHHFEGALEVEELARAEVAERWLAVVCRAEAGIYEVEQRLRRLHGDRLGIIVLLKSPGHYTLRKADPSLPLSLERIYEQMNLMDPAAGSLRSGNRWGGSDDIGGSPRSGDSRLSPQDIAGICGRAFRKPTPPQQIRAVLKAVAATAALPAAALLARIPQGTEIWGLAPLGAAMQVQSWSFAVVLCLTGLILLAVAARAAPRLHGLRMPAGIDWLLLLPFAAVAGVVAGARFPVAFMSQSGTLFAYPANLLPVVLTLVTGAEILFRGVVFGILRQEFQAPGRKPGWVPSWPVLISSFLYLAWAGFPFSSFAWPGSLYTLGGAFLLALACGIARDRSHSLLPPIVLHCAAVLVPVFRLFR